ncbi:MAG: hemolysin family protein [Treponema sp.]|nr:hemolysin family protein [Treponema sp.]
MLLSIALLFVLVLISGVLSSSEIAVSSSNRNKVKMLADEGDKRAQRLLDTINKPHSFFATTQLYYTFIAFFSGAYAASSFTEPLVQFAIRLGLPLYPSVMEPFAFIIVTAILTYVTLILGELVPKRIAMEYAIPFALRILSVLKVLSIIALPFVKLLSASSRFILQLMGFKDSNPEAVATKEEIRMIVGSSSEHGQIAESEQGMIENIFKIEKLTAGEICTHRLNVVALPIEADFKTVVATLSGKYFSRVPVYEGSLDNVRGFLHTKDVFNYMATNDDVSGFRIQEQMREAYFVPLSKRLDELFEEMRKEGTNLAVVIDEYGGTLGIITLEDLIEKIVGSIQDEYDEDEIPDITAVDINSYKIQGTVSLETVMNHFDVQLPVDQYETLSGFLIGQVGHIPSNDENLELEYSGLRFKVERIRKKRISSVFVTKLDEKVED